jgi:hypothetical protein
MPLINNFKDLISGIRLIPRISIIISAFNYLLDAYKN